MLDDLRRRANRTNHLDEPGGASKAHLGARLDVDLEAQRPLEADRIKRLELRLPIDVALAEWKLLPSLSGHAAVRAADQSHALFERFQPVRGILSGSKRRGRIPGGSNKRMVDGLEQNGQLLAGGPRHTRFIEHGDGDAILRRSLARPAERIGSRLERSAVSSRKCRDYDARAADPVGKAERVIEGDKPIQYRRPAAGRSLENARCNRDRQNIGLLEAPLDFCLIDMRNALFCASHGAQLHPF